MRHLRLLGLLLAVFALLAGGCGGGKKDVPDDAVAIVGGDEISKAEFDSLIARARETYKQQKRPFPKAGTPEYKLLQNQALQYLVQQSQYEQKAEDLDVEITDKELDDRLAQIKKQYFSGSEKQYQEHLKKNHLTEEQIRNDVKQQLISEQIYEKVTSDIEVTDDEIKKYYNTHKGEYKQAESREVRHILVSKKPLAQDLYQQLKDGANFAKLARKYSKDPSSKAQGGKLTITRGQTVPPFDQTAFLLGKNTISQPVKTQYGWHIIQPISEIRPARTTPLKDVKEQIRQQLLAERKREAIAKWSEGVKKEFAKKTSYQVGFAPPPTSTQAMTTG